MLSKYNTYTTYINSNQSHANATYIHLNYHTYMLALTIYILTKHMLNFSHHPKTGIGKVHKQIKKENILFKLF